MGLPRRGTRRRGVAALASALLAPLAFAGVASGADTRALTIGAGADRSCATSSPASGSGVASTRWTAARDSAVQARLAGRAGDDWDLALFDARSGRLLDASLSPGSTEVVQAVVRRGSSVVVQACRLRGTSARMPLVIDSVGVRLSAPGTPAPKASLVQIGLRNPGLDIASLTRLGINLNEAPEGDHVSAIVGPAEKLKLSRAGYGYKVLEADLRAAHRRYKATDLRAAAAGRSALPSGRNTYRRLRDYQAELKALAARYPKLARNLTLPKKTFQGRTVAGLEITASVRRRDDGKPAHFLMGLHHAREWPAAEIPMEFARYLVQSYGKDKRVTRLMRRVRFFVVPVINPDGFHASRESFDPADETGDPGGAPSLAEIVAPPGGILAYRRKNCVGNSPNPATPCNLQHGVDPNRNYGHNWGGPGASTMPIDQTYRGRDMWSERETQNVHEFSRRHNITTLVTVHTFGALVLRPPGLHTEGLAPDEPAMKRLGDAMARAVGYTSQYSYQLYDTSGTTEDWNYAAAGTYGYTYELGPTSTHGGNFHTSYQRAVVNQWTGAETARGKGKGLREAILLAGETAANRQEFSTLTGRAPPGSRLRLRKDFRTFSAKNICAAATDQVDCGAAVLPQRSQKDFLDYTTIVRGNGKFNWIVTPSTRPFELKKGKREKWTLTCENPVSGKVQERRLIEVDRGQTVRLNMRCGGKPFRVNAPRGCIDDTRKFRFQVHKPHKGRIRRVNVYLDGKRILAVKGRKARRKYLYLRNLRKRRDAYRLTIIVYMSTGRQHVTTRRFTRCSKSAPRGFYRNPRGRGK